MPYVNQHGKRHLVGDMVEMNGTKYQIMDYKLNGMVVVRNLSKEDAWVYQVMSPESLGLHWID